jgi:hypothetical protein
VNPATFALLDGSVVSGSEESFIGTHLYAFKVQPPCTFSTSSAAIMEEVSVLQTDPMPNLSSQYLYQTYKMKPENREENEPTA